MKKVAVLRNELKGDTPYGSLLGVFDTIEEANKEIISTLYHLTEKEKASCRIWSGWVPVDQLGFIVWESEDIEDAETITHN